MNIEKYIKEAHGIAIEKGWYDCGDCAGELVSKKLSDCNNKCTTCHIYNSCEEYNSICGVCNGTGKADRNIGEMLMLIVSELGEALGAHRCNNFARWDNYEWQIEKSGLTETESFKENIKDSFEDEIADVFIRLFDLCGYLKLDVSIIEESFNDGDADCDYDNINIGETLLTFICYDIERLREGGVDDKGKAEYMGESFSWLNGFCNLHNIPIEKHIAAKMAYNKTRPRKHGKQY